MNQLTKQKKNHRCRKQIYGYQGEREGRDKLGDGDWYIHTTMYKADDLYKNLLCSRGNSTQNSVMAFMGKESKKEQRVT